MTYYEKLYKERLHIEIFMLILCIFIVFILVRAELIEKEAREYLNTVNNTANELIND